MTAKNGTAKSKEEYLSQLDELVGNVMLSREEFFNRILQRGHDIDKECGYPSNGELTPDAYRDLHDRDPIANRINQLMPRESWQGCPTIYEDEDATKITEFEEAWDELGNSLLPSGKSYFTDEEGSPIWEHLIRADILSGIGQFGVILLGIDDGRNLQDPTDGVNVLVNSVVNSKRCIECLPDSPPHESEREDRFIQLYPNMPGDNVLINREQVAIVHSDKGWLAVNRDNGALLKMKPANPTGSAPGDGPFIQGSDRQYSEGFGIGMPSPLSSYQPQPSLSGTDQQYFGVQFGPSEAFGPSASKKKRKLLFLRCFDESLVQVVRYEWNIRNPRFGLPVMYRITLNDPRQPHSGVGLPLATVYVHWSRVIHLADNLHASEIFGIPRTKPVINEILDLRKVRGASGEGYWKSCFTGLSLETNPQLGGDVKIDKPGLRQMMVDYQERLQRYIALSGMSAKTLAPSVVDPTPFIAIRLEAICIKTGCPVRVFKGSERGELASSQDDEAWNERKQERRQNYITPKIIVPFVDRLIQIGVLPEPEEYHVKWPDLDALGDKDKAAIALTQVQAMAAYVGGNVESILPPHDFFTRTMEWDEETADEVLDAAEKAQEEKEEDAQDLADEHGFMLTPPQGFTAPQPPPGQPGKPEAGGAKPGGAGGGGVQQPKVGAIKPPTTGGPPPKPGQPAKPAANVESDEDIEPRSYESTRNRLEELIGV